MRKITETQLRVLERLSDYRFLTVGQMQRIGIAKNTQTIHRAIKALHDGKKPLVNYAEFGTFPTIGRLPRINYLTKYGAETLAEALQRDPTTIYHPKGVKLFTRDYFHRIETIDLHILARSFCEAHEGVEFDFFQAYFEHKGANNWKDTKKPKREAINKIQIDNETAIIPDCILQITDPKGIPWLFVGEIYRGHDTKRVHQQLDRYLHALEKGSVNKAYQYDRKTPILVVCESENAMLSLMKRLKNDEAFKYTEDYFLFRLLSVPPNIISKSTKAQSTGLHTRAKVLSTLQSFDTGWRTYTGKKKVLFC